MSNSFDLQTVIGLLYRADWTRLSLSAAVRSSCRLSFYLYNTPGEVDRAVDAVAAIAAGRGAPAPH